MLTGGREKERDWAIEMLLNKMLRAAGQRTRKATEIQAYIGEIR